MMVTMSGYNEPPAWGFSAPAAAHAKSLNDNCISYPEWASFERGTMKQVEARNDVTGTVVHTQQQGQLVLKQYSRCGMTQAQGFYQVFYAKNQAGQYMSQYITQWNLTKGIAHQTA